MQWQQEKNLQDVELRDQNRPDTGFLSWSNYIKKHREDPSQRYQVAQKFLPWPLGFKESVLALRAIIRDKKKTDVDYESDLLSLYHLAAWESFCPKQCESIDEPAFKIFDQIPGGVVADLEVDYQQLGYEQLKLVTKTDAKMLVSLYGEPKQHSTLNQLYAEVWQQAEQDYLNRLQKSEPAEQLEEASEPKLKYGLSTASRKYDANGEVIASQKSPSQAEKHIKARIKSSQKATQETEKEDRYSAMVARGKQLSGLVVQALRERRLIKERVLNGSLKNIKQTLANKKMVTVLGASCLVMTRKLRSHNRNK